MGAEKTAEKSLVKSIKSLNMVAWHMDCSIDGFPDILALGNNNCSFTCEVKEGSRDMLLSKSLEPTQPVWHMNAGNAGYWNTFLVLYTGSVYVLYQATGLVEKVFLEMRYSDLTPIMESTRSIDVASEMKRRSSL